VSERVAEGAVDRVERGGGQRRGIIRNRGAAQSRLLVGAARDLLDRGRAASPFCAGVIERSRGEAGTRSHAYPCRREGRVASLRRYGWRGAVGPPGAAPAGLRRPRPRAGPRQTHKKGAPSRFRAAQPLGLRQGAVGVYLINEPLEKPGSRCSRGLAGITPGVEFVSAEPGSKRSLFGGQHNARAFRTLLLVALL
jgi:hypothetical protein